MEKRKEMMEKRSNGRWNFHGNDPEPRIELKITTTQLPVGPVRRFSPGSPTIPRLVGPPGSEEVRSRRLEVSATARRPMIQEEPTENRLRPRWARTYRV